MMESTELQALPRVFVIGNNCLSQTNANGRTLSEFFFGYPKEKLAQFYIKKGTPNFDVCERFYFVSDREAVKAVLNRKVGRPIRPQDMDGADQSAAASAPAEAGKDTAKKLRKKVAAVMARNLVWNLGCWKNRQFWEWVRDFDPQCIVFQSGDSTFMVRLAYDLSVKLNIPLILYNSEDYYFKEENYFNDRALDNFLYKAFFIRDYRRRFRKLMERAAHSVYICPSLKELYDEEFHRPSTVLMTATHVTCGEGNRTADDPAAEKKVFSYLGNLGLKRYESLVEIANALNRIDPAYQLDVYGRASAEACVRAFAACPNIRYKGFVSYDEVVAIMKQSDLLFHAESFDPAIVDQLRYAFTTKIADSLASGTCFVFYAPPSIEGSKYLTANGCACVITDPADLENGLRRVLNHRDLREQYVQRALQVAAENHNSLKNCEKMRTILCESMAGK